MFNSKIKFIPARLGERYKSASSSENLSNKIFKLYGKISLKNYVDSIVKKKKLNFHCLQKFFIRYKPLAGDFCESAIPDPIPNSEVKTFCADGTLS